MAEPLHRVEAEVVEVAAPDDRHRLLRIGGPGLDVLLRRHRPADAVRIDLPGNEPCHRVYTLRDVDREHGTALLDVLLDGGGPGARWADAVSVGDAVVLHGSRYGYDIDPTAPAFVLIGDDTAGPAIAEICRGIPEGAPVHVLVLGEVPPASWRSGAVHADLASVLAALDARHPLPRGTRYWCAGEADLVRAARQRIRVDHGVARSHARFAIYWRRGLRPEQAATIEDAERRRIVDHGVTLDDVHDHDDIEPLVDLADDPRSPAPSSLRTGSG